MGLSYLTSTAEEPWSLVAVTGEISLIQLIWISTADLVFCLTDLILWGFLDAFYLQI
jgi:hypothetical protein